MVKICQREFLKLYQKPFFPVFAKNFRKPWMKLKILFCQFPNPSALRVSEMGCYTSKCEKSQNHCTLLPLTSGSMASAWERIVSSSSTSSLYIQLSFFNFLWKFKKETIPSIVLGKLYIWWDLLLDFKHLIATVLTLKKCVFWISTKGPTASSFLQL